MPSNKKRNVSATSAAAAPTAANKSTSTTSTTRTTYTQEFNPDYSVVINDLRRIGIMAGCFLVILVGLSFFLR